MIDHGLLMLHEFATQQGRTNPLLEDALRRERVLVPAFVTAAVISKPKLFIVTLEFGKRNGPAICTKRSGHFELWDRSARAANALANLLARFLHRARIDQVFLRVSNDAGRYVAHSHAFKIETVLQLQEGIRVDFVHTQAVSRWLGRDDPLVPRPQELGLGGRWPGVQLEAIEAAMFAAHNHHDPRAFFDGARSDG